MLTFPKIQWSGKRDSNPRPSAWKADALANWAIPAFETNLFLGVNMVERGGFEPPKAEPADLQSAPFGHSGTSPLWGSVWSYSGASEGNRTPDPLITNQLLCHLSYAGSQAINAQLDSIILWLYYFKP